MSKAVTWSEYCKKWAKINNVSYAAAMQLCRKDYYDYKEASNKTLEKRSNKKASLENSNERIKKRKKKVIYAEECTTSSSSSEEEENYYGRKTKKKVQPKKQYPRVKVVQPKKSTKRVYVDESEEESESESD